MYYVYVIKSRIDHNLYIGYTGDLKKRLSEHNHGKTKSIKHRVPFDLIYYEAFRAKKDARIRELELKKNNFAKEQMKDRLKDSLIDTI